MMKRIFDLSIGLIAFHMLLIPMLFIAILVKISSEGPVLFWSNRVGKNSRIFKMPKFRSMRFDTPDVATHLLTNPENYLTPVGKFLRKTSLDELPQLWSIIVGDMSFVGPRPALYNQDDLIALRRQTGVDSILPGLTGWAQVNGRDELPIPEKVNFDVEYLHKKSLLFDCYIVWLTILNVLAGKGIRH
jgi:O-antigen biosynthesis protein WbqP